MSKIKVSGCLILAFICASCRTPAPELGYVKGVVTIDGKPAANVGVMFIPTGGERSDVYPVATAETDEQGRYELFYAPLPKDRADPPARVRGATIGKNKVVLEDSLSKSHDSRAASRFHMRYSQLGNPALEYEVKPGEQTYDIALKLN